MSKRVLLVDDSPDVLRSMSLLLELEGCHVTTAVDGQEARRVVREAADGFAFAIVDLVLPDAQGDALAAELRAKLPGLPVVLTSGYSEDEERLRALPERTTFLRKPFLFEQLRAAAVRVAGAW